MADVGGGGQAVLGGRLAVHGHRNLRHLLGHRAGHVNGVLQRGDARSQVLTNLAEDLIILTGNRHTDVAAAAHHGRHVGGAGGNLTPGDIPEILP